MHHRNGPKLHIRASPTPCPRGLAVSIHGPSIEYVHLRENISGLMCGLNKDGVGAVGRAPAWMLQETLLRCPQMGIGGRPE